MSEAYTADEIEAAEARRERMKPGDIVVTTDRYAEQFPAPHLPWRGTILRITKRGMVAVKWLNSQTRRQEELHPLFLKTER